VDLKTSLKIGGSILFGLVICETPSFHWSSKNGRLMVSLQLKMLIVSTKQSSVRLCEPGEIERDAHNPVDGPRRDPVSDSSTFH
jgi:hypothetical protein